MSIIRPRGKKGTCSYKGCLNGREYRESRHTTDLARRNANNASGTPAVAAPATRLPSARTPTTAGFWERYAEWAQAANLTGAGFTPAGQRDLAQPRPAFARTCARSGFVQPCSGLDIGRDSSARVCSATLGFDLERRWRSVVAQRPRRYAP